MNRINMNRMSSVSTVRTNKQVHCLSSSINIYVHCLSMFTAYLVQSTANSINQTVYNILFSMLAGLDGLTHKLPQQLLHLSLSNGSNLCIPYFLISHFTLCSHVFVGLPLPLHPGTSKLRHCDTQTSTSFLSTCPYQRNLPFRTTSATLTIPRRPSNSSCVTAVHSEKTPY